MHILIHRLRQNLTLLVTDNHFDTSILATINLPVWEIAHLTLIMSERLNHQRIFERWN